VLTETVGLALLAAISPTALLVSAVFLGAASPFRTILIYLAGAILMTALMAALVYVVLRAGHLYKPHERDPRYGLRLGLGVLMLAVGCYLLPRGRLRRAQPARQDRGLISRMIATPGAREAFLVGVLLYSPSLTFVAAVQTVATSDADTAAAIGVLALVVVITLLCIWVPLLLYLLKPDRTVQLLGSFNGWLRANGFFVLAAALAIGGAFLAVNGILGLMHVVS
jgi:Sap, sulfolipid-1-addressing protein